MDTLFDAKGFINKQFINKISAIYTAANQTTGLDVNMTLNSLQMYVGDMEPELVSHPVEVDIFITYTKL